MRINGCPSDQELLDFHLGNLPAAVQDRVAGHLEACPYCETALQKVEDVTDPVLAALRRPVRAAVKAPTRSFAAHEANGSIVLATTRSSRDEWPRVPGFEVRGVLGQGGMGIVYQARQVGLNRVVALKMVTSGVRSGVSALTRFCREAEAVARLQHPNIVQVHEIGHWQPSAGGPPVPFLCLEYVDGGSLADQLTGTPQPVRHSAELIETLARAIHHAHQHQIVHRDLKPGNVLLTRAGIPKITDFGLARQLDSDVQLTQVGMVAGTPTYMAPEQACDPGNGTGPAADVYSLGVMLYELLTGRVPLDGASPVETLLLVRTQEPVPPSRLQPRLPRDLETICLKCLQKDPRKRYPSAQALADDLRRFLDRKPIVARPTSAGERCWKWARRQPALAGLLACLVVVTLLGFVGVSWQWRDAVQARDDAVAERQDKEEQRRQAVTALDQAEINVYFSRIAQARLEWRLNHDTTAARTLLERCRPGAGQTDRRGWEWHHLQGLTNADLLTLRGHPLGFIDRVAYSPDGRLLASAGGGDHYVHTPGHAIEPGEVILWDAVTGKKRLTLTGQAHVIADVAFSPDGRRLATASYDGTVWLRDVATGEIVHQLPGRARILAIAFSPDGRRLATAPENQPVILWDPATGKALGQLQGEAGRVTSMAFSPDGGRLVTGSQASTAADLCLWDAASGRRLQRLDGFSSTKAGGVAFSPDGTLLASVNGAAKIWDLATGRLLHTLTGYQGDMLAVAFSPDGQQLATAGADQAVHLWDVGTGREQALLRGHQEQVHCLGFHPTGRFLASGDRRGTVKVWDLTRHPEYALVQPPDGLKAEAIAFLEDRRRLAFILPGGDLKVRDCLADGRGRDHLLEMTNAWMTPAQVAAFDGSGRRLAAVSRQDPHVVNVWETATGKELCVLGGPGSTPEARHHVPVHQVSFSLDGRRVATSGSAHTQAGAVREIKVWDTASGRQVLGLERPILPQRHLYGGLALSPDGTRLAFDAPPAQAPHDPAAVLQMPIHVYDLVTGRQVVLAGPGALVRHLAFSPDGNLLAVADHADHIAIWDLAARKPLQPIPLVGTVYQLAFSPNGQRLAGINREQVQLWDVASGQEILSLRGAPPRPSDNGFNPRLAWSGDGTCLAASNWDGSITVWDALDRDSAAARTSRLRAAEDRTFAWHVARATLAQRREAAFAFAFHWRFLEPAVPPSGSAQRGRGNLHAGLGQWTAAAVACSRGLTLQPSNDLRHWFRTACMQVLAGDAVGHRRTCEDAERWFSGLGEDQYFASMLVQMAALRDSGPSEPPVLVARAQRAVEQRPRLPWLAHHALALAHYRAGQFDQAVRRSEAALIVSPTEDIRALSHLVLGLSLRRLGRSAEAEQWLRRAEDWLRQATRGAPDQPHRLIALGVPEGLAFLVLWREAQR